MVLEKTFESPLDCKEIQPVHPKGYWSWVFIGGLMLKLKLQYFGHLMGRVDSLEKTLMLGGIGWRKRTPAKTCVQFSSIQFSSSVVSYSLQPHELQHNRPPCPSPSPGVHSDSCPSSQRCHPATSSSVVPFFSCLQSLPASKSFPMSQLFT